MKRARVFAGCWMGFFALYEIFAAQISTAEIVLGIVLGFFGAAMIEVVRQNSQHHFQMKPRWLGKLAPVPWQMLRDCFVIFGAILRRPFAERGSGRFELRQFHPGNEHPASRGRRAFVTFAISCAPNSIVLGTAEPNEQLVVHLLVPTKSEGRDPDWPL